MARIRINPEQVRQVASQFDRAASQSEDMVRSLTDAVNGMQSEWEGMASQRFYGYFQQRSTQMRQFIELLRGINTQLNQIADRFTAADQHLMNQAREKLNNDPNMTNMWRQVEAPIQSKPGQRDPERYSMVIDQFDVEHRYPGRYRPDDKHPDTRCNIFAGDVMRAMGAPLPTKGELYNKVDPMTANAPDIHNALEKGWGGWRKIDINNPEDLQRLLDHLKAGKPAVASDNGHIAVIRPNGLPKQLTPQNLGELHIAQAGKENKNDILLENAGLGTAFNPDFYIHD